MSVIIIILLLLSFCAFHFAVYTTNYATLIEVNFFYFPAATFAVSQTESPPLRLSAPAHLLPFSLKIILQLISTSGNYEFLSFGRRIHPWLVACLRELAAFLIELPHPSWLARMRMSWRMRLSSFPSLPLLLN